MTVRDVFENAIQELGITAGGNSPVFIRSRVIADINAALQTMTAGVDYFTRVPLSFNIDPGTPTGTFPETALNIWGPFRLGDGSPLTVISNRGDFDIYPQIFLGFTGQAPAARPSGIFFDKGNRNGDPNSVQVVARFSPTPDQSYTVTGDISYQPPEYLVSDLSEPSPTIPLPQRFAESILLPIVRWNCRSHPFFTRVDMLPSMKDEYNLALRQLGIAEPTEGEQTDKTTAARASAQQTSPR